MRFSQQLAVSVVFILAAAAGAQADVLPNGIKGVKLQMTKAQAFQTVEAMRDAATTQKQQQFAQFREVLKPSCFPDKHLGAPYERCGVVGEGITYASIPVRVIMLSFHADRLQHVELQFHKGRLPSEKFELFAGISSQLKEMLEKDGRSIASSTPAELTWESPERVLSVVRDDGNTSAGKRSPVVVRYWTRAYLNTVLQKKEALNPRRLDL